jgi:BolA protein
MKERIEQLLRDAFHPSSLEVIDESHKHADHNPEAVAGGTHFRVRITAGAFEGKTPVQRHRMVYDALKGPLQERVHALAIEAKSR